MGVSQNTDTDIALIAEGGANFTARMTSFYEAKKQMEEAFAALQLGKSAKAAYDAANKDREAAGALLQTTKNDIATMLAQAQEQSQQIVAAASDANAAAAEANAALKMELEERNRQSKIDADAAVKDAKAAAAESRKATLEAKKAADKAAIDAEEYKTAIALANAAKSQYEEALAKLKATLAAVEI